PDIIVVRNGEKSAFSSGEGYKELKAVKEGKVYEIDNNMLDRQGPRQADGLEALAKILHPEAFK
ncbi:MAG: ABC transporter substrate-binding protein, partial [Clostridiaceae bacterium]